MTSEKVLDIFKEITKIPRESGHEEQIIAFLQDFAASHSLECRTDAAGNVVIVKEASAGKEDIPTLVLQSHSDMVCEKNSDVEHDFSKDPIKYVIRDGWMIAEETTLGADCGIGMAAQLALLESDLPMGRIECLFTVSEETGLDGAKALKPGFITGKVLINLDSEDEGELFVGCAGGIDTTAVFNYVTEKLSFKTNMFYIKISNGSGGHSGDDIDKGRANAVQLLARFLYGGIDNIEGLCHISGGNKRNAIAREADAVIVYADEMALRESFDIFVSSVKEEFSSTDPDLIFELRKLPESAYEECIPSETAKAIIMSLYAAPHGVLEMSREIPGLVQTSTNLASVRMVSPGTIRVGTSQRSSLTSSRRAAASKVEACFRLAGAEVRHESEYPGWNPDLGSCILEQCRSSYVKLFGKEPVVRAIHAGLECGLFLDIFPDLDMISFGPTLRGVHAPGERLDLASLDRFVSHLTDVVLNFK